MDFLVVALKSFPHCASMVVKTTIEKEGVLTDSGFRREFSAAFPILYGGLEKREQERAICS